jgi:hypothetical protein
VSAASPGNVSAPAVGTVLIVVGVVAAQRCIPRSAFLALMLWAVWPSIGTRDPGVRLGAAARTKLSVDGSRSTGGSKALVEGASAQRDHDPRDGERTGEHHQARAPRVDDLATHDGDRVEHRGPHRSPRRSRMRSPAALWRHRCRDRTSTGWRSSGTKRQSSRPKNAASTSMRVPNGATHWRGIARNAAPTTTQTTAWTRAKVAKSTSASS